MKLKALLLFVLMALIIPSAQPIAAQTAKPECRAGDLLAAMSALKSQGDNAKDMQTLLAISAKISEMNLACNGFTLTGTGNKVLDPFTLPVGTWKISVKTKQSFILHGRSMEGSDCVADKEASLFNEVNLEGGGDVDAQTVLPIKAACRLLFTTSNSSAPWTLTFEPIQ